jgi:quercetin dioxygenase-like cupin family protein
MEPISLTVLADLQLAQARSVKSGRSAHTVHGGHGRILRQTVVALVQDHRLDDHESPGEATLQVLIGAVRLATETDSWNGTAGDLLAIPRRRHSLTALRDAVVLLTVVVGSRTPQP